MDYSDLLGPCVFAMAGDKGVSIRQGFFFFFFKFFFLVFTYQEKKPEADVIEDNDN